MLSPRSRIVAIGVVFVLAIGIASPVRAAIFWAITDEKEEGATMYNRSHCDANIRNTPKTYLRSNGKNYQAACEGAGLAPALSGSSTSSYMAFRTDSNYSGGASKTRTELQNSNYVPTFGNHVRIGFRLRIPNASDVPNKSHFILQLWQCQGQAPIAGVRVQDNGTKSAPRLGFFYKNDDTGSRGSANVVSNVQVTNGWHEFALVYNISDVEGDSSIQVWKDGSKIGEVEDVTVGFHDVAGCAERFKIKWGIYKGSGPEHGKYFVTHYDEMLVGSQLSEVTPW